MFGLNTSISNFGKQLYNEITEDNVATGAAALAYYFTLAIFPAMIFLLSLLPYLPIADLQQAIMDFMRQALPGEAASLLSDTVTSIVNEKSGGLLSFGLIATLWATSSGMYAVMRQLNQVYDVEEVRAFLKARAVALGLTLFFSLLIILAFALIVLGGQLQSLLASVFGWDEILLTFFAVMRWAIVIAAILTAFSVVYYWGPNAKHDYVFISPGNIFGTVVIALSSLLFKWYISNFGNYDATYGSIGAVIILMLWLYVFGLVLLIGAEINQVAARFGVRHLAESNPKRTRPAEA